MADASTLGFTRSPSLLKLKRKIFTVVMTILLVGLALLGVVPLGAILIEIVRRGLPNFRWEVFTSLPAPVGVENEPNGFVNAIVGTLTMVIIGSLLSIPFGVLTGIFLSEYRRGSLWVKIIRFTCVVLSSVPTVIVGVFAYGILVLTTKQFSAVAGGLALGVIMLPIIALTTEEALKLVPIAYRLGSSALGGSRFATIFRVVIPVALPGMTTGILLAVARAAGETAPLMFTALFTQFWQEGVWGPTPSLTVLIYNYASSPYAEQNAIAWTASLVLVALVLVINVMARFVIRKQA